MIRPVLNRNGNSNGNGNGNAYAYALVASLLAAAHGRRLPTRIVAALQRLTARGTRRSGRRSGTASSPLDQVIRSLGGPLLEHLHYAHTAHGAALGITVAKRDGRPRDPGDGA